MAGPDPHSQLPSGPKWRDSAAVFFALSFPSLLTWVYFVQLDGQGSRTQQSAFGVLKTIQFAFPILWVIYVQRRRPTLLKPDRLGLGLATSFGVAVVAGMLGLYFAVLRPLGLLEQASDQIRIKVSGFGVDSPATFFALGAFYSLVHSFLEEYYWRWFVFGQLRRLCPVSFAMVVSSVGFMAHHVIVLGYYFGWSSPLTYAFSAAVGVGGLVWAWLYQRTQSLYAPWLSHMIVDAGIFLLGYDIIRPAL